MLSIIISCTSIKSLTRDTCLNKTFDFIIANDISTILFQKKELLLVVKFFDTQQKNFKAAVIDKKTFPEYLADKNENAIGYDNYKGFSIIFYGRIPQNLNLLAIDKNMKFMVPLIIKKTKSNQPPIEPSNFEPSIYTFKKSKNCYILLQKTIADNLLE